MGADLSAREDRLPPLEIARRAAARHRPTRCRSPAPRSSPACSSPACWPRARRGSSSRCRAATTPSACWPPPGAVGRARDGDAVVDRSPPSGSNPSRSLVPADISSAAFFLVAALLVPGSEVELEGGRPQPDPHRPADDPRADGRRRSSVDAERRGGRRADRRPPRPLRALRGHRGRRRRDPAGDRRAAAGRPRRLLRRGDDDDPRRRGAAAQGVRPDRDRDRGAARARRRGRADRGRDGRSRAPAACAAARSTPTATTGSRCSAPSPASPRARASRSRGMDAAAVSYPGFEADLAPSSPLTQPRTCFHPCLS